MYSMHAFNMQLSVAVCDYQLEVNLISYNNSARMLQDGQCCESNALAMCSEQDSCDVRFTFSAENINTVTTFSDQNKVVGTYENSDVIRFDNCSTFKNGVRNPLTFIIPSNQWKSGVGHCMSYILCFLKHVIIVAKKLDFVLILGFLSMIFS